VSRAIPLAGGSTAPFPKKGAGYGLVSWGKLAALSCQACLVGLLWIRRPYFWLGIKELGTSYSLKTTCWPSGRARCVVQAACVLGERSCFTMRLGPLTGVHARASFPRSVSFSDIALVLRQKAVRLLPCDFSARSVVTHKPG